MLRFSYQFFLLFLGLVVVGIPNHSSAKNDTPTKEEVSLSKVPIIRFYDRRLKKVYKELARQYKHLYGHAAADGYIFPNERRDLLFQRRHMNRIVIIDKRNHKVLSLYKKHQRKYKYKRRRRKMTREDKQLFIAILKHKKRYEKMIRRFACRYISRYKKYHPTHCIKRKYPL